MSGFKVENVRSLASISDCSIIDLTVDDDEQSFRESDSDSDVSLSPRKLKYSFFKPKPDVSFTTVQVFSFRCKHGEDMDYRHDSCSTVTVDEYENSRSTRVKPSSLIASVMKGKEKRQKRRKIRYNNKRRHYLDKMHDTNNIHLVKDRCLIDWFDDLKDDSENSLSNEGELLDMSECKESYIPTFPPTEKFPPSEKD